MSRNIQRKPKHHIAAGEAVPMKKGAMAGIRELSRRMSEWEQKRGIAPRKRFSIHPGK